jgi:hypothetical protein
MEPVNSSTRIGKASGVIAADAVRWLFSGVIL